MGEDYVPVLDLEESGLRESLPLDRVDVRRRRLDLNAAGDERCERENQEDDANNSRTKGEEELLAS